MSSTPTISVVIPAYNYGSQVQCAIDSVLSQNIDDIEIIVIDDASTDETDAVIRKYHDARVVHLTNDHNLGVTPTINRGFKQSKGTFVCVLAADDTLPPSSLKNRYDFLVENNCQAVHAGITVLKDNHEQYISPLDTSLPITIVNFLKTGSESHGINSCTFLYSQQVFQKIGYRDESEQYFPHNDYEFALRTLLNCKVGFIDVPVYRYNRHAGSHIEQYATSPTAHEHYTVLVNTYIKEFEKKKTG